MDIPQDAACLSFAELILTELFQLQMRILFPFLLTKNIHRFLLLMGTRILYSPLRRGYIRKVSLFGTKIFSTMTYLIVHEARE